MGSQSEYIEVGFAVNLTCFTNQYFHDEHVTKHHCRHRIWKEVSRARWPYFPDPAETDNADDL